MRLLVYLLLAIAAVTTVLQLLGINVDVAISSLFYDPATHTFLADNSHPKLAQIRENGMIAIAT